MFYYALDGSIPSHRKVCETLLSETGCNNCHAGGILPGTMVETDRGTTDISQIKSGDYLATFEHGMQQVVDISASSVWTSEAVCGECFWPYYVPESVLGNTDPVFIMPEHQVLFESDILKAETGHAHALVPIRALEGFCGIRKIVPIKRVLSYKVKFATNELLILNGGTILNCKLPTDFFTEIMQPPHSFPFLDSKETKELLTKTEADAIASVQLGNIKTAG